MNKCPNCGSDNIMGSSFCVKCGGSLQNTILEPTQVVVEPVTPNVSIQNQNQNLNINQSSNVNQSQMAMKYYFVILIAILLKPFTTLKEEKHKFSSFKNSGILAGVVAVFATLLRLLGTMLQQVRVTNYSYTKGTTTTWVWKNLKEISYFKIIGESLLIFLGILFVVAVLYYIGSLILKKDVSFPKLLGVSTLSFVPMILGNFLLAPIFSIIHSYLGVFCSILGAIYTLVILYEGINQEVTFEGDTKIYFHSVCFSILAFGIYFVYMKYLTSTITSGLENVLDMLK